MAQYFDGITPCRRVDTSRSRRSTRKEAPSTTRVGAESRPSETEVLARASTAQVTRGPPGAVRKKTRRESSVLRRTRARSLRLPAPAISTSAVLGLVVVG